MNIKKTKGNEAEKAAAEDLTRKGFQIIEKNYRYKRAEIDLIAIQKDLILFVEVKYRKNSNFGHPEDFVSPRQQELILAAAQHYLEKNAWQGQVRFDIIAVDGQMKITHFEDAFH